MEVRSDLAEALVARRKHLGLTRGAVAAAADLDISALFRLETGKREPLFSTVERLARVLRFDVMVGPAGTIITWEDGAKPKPKPRPRRKKRKTALPSG